MPFKLELFHLFLITLILSCSNNHSRETENKALNDNNNNTVISPKGESNENKSIYPPRYLDTIKLKEKGIAFKKLKSNKYEDQYLVTVTDTIPKSKQIQVITYNFIASMYDNNSDVLFQLDSLFIKLPDKVQAFGFNRDGGYLHSYESLVNPDIDFNDYNFDGIVDFSVQSGGSGTNEVRYYYIYDATSRRFNSPISLANAYFDKNKKLVYQSWHISSAEGGQSVSRFTKADTLVMILSENREYIDSLDLYVKETKLLQKNGSYSITFDTAKRE